MKFHSELPRPSHEKKAERATSRAFCLRINQCIAMCVKCLRRKRFDYFLIWGNGVQYKDEIVSIIRSKEFIRILRIMHHSPKDIAKFVQTVYSYDYAPFEHLRSKTRYLLESDPNAIFIFVRNEDAREIYRGQGAFRHVECARIKALKEEIRDRFNPRKDGERTEEHVVHASDNESQTDHILKYLGFKEGIGLFRRVPNQILSPPYYLPEFEEFRVRRVNSSQLYCSILRETKESFWKAVIPIEETPHFECLMGNVAAYRKYLARCRRDGRLRSDYSVDNFLELSQNLTYLQDPYVVSYILVKEMGPNRYIILDGVHRASILKYKGVDKLPVAIVQ